GFVPLHKGPRSGSHAFSCQFRQKLVSARSDALKHAVMQCKSWCLVSCSFQLCLRCLDHGGVGGGGGVDPGLLRHWPTRFFIASAKRESKTTNKGSFLKTIPGPSFPPSLLPSFNRHQLTTPTAPSAQHLAIRPPS